MDGAGVAESPVFEKKLNDVAMPGASAGAECLDIAERQWCEPAPVPAQSSLRPRPCGFGGLLSRHKTSGQGADHSRGGHRLWAAESLNQSDYA